MSLDHNSPWHKWWGIHTDKWSLWARGLYLSNQAFLWIQDFRRLCCNTQPLYSGSLWRRSWFLWTFICVWHDLSSYPDSFMASHLLV